VPQELHINKISTYIPLGIVATVLATSVWLQSWITSQFDTQKSYMIQEFRRSHDGVDALEKRVYAVELLNHNRWDELDMKEWALELRTQNPTLQVPVIKD
jgi:hypothetical protein